MNFREATDRLFARIDHEDLARELGVSVAAIRQARLRGEARANRSPPAQWRSAAIALAERRMSHYAELLDALKADEQQSRTSRADAIRMKMTG